MFRFKTYFSGNDNSLIHKQLIYSAIFIVLLIIYFVLFLPPVPGVADQGDFQRVMTVVGLEDLNKDSVDFQNHWFKYVVSEFRMNSLDLDRIIGKIPTTSLLYPILVGRLLCRILRYNTFNTRVLAALYSIIYIFALYLCIKNIKISKNFTFILFISISIFILFDGNYLVWFNSLYGEPMMISSFLLLIGAVLNAINRDKRYSVGAILLVIAAAWLFLGSKIQTFPSLPLIIVMIIRVSFNKNRYAVGIIKKIVYCISIFLLVRYVHGIYAYSNSRLGIDTAYNSVFYGILKNTNNPEKALMELGLSPDLAVEAGKNAYLSNGDYVKYIPRSELTKREFNDKINNVKLLKYYLKHPIALLKGMEYTAEHSLDTSTFLGKYEKSEVNSYIFKFNRFTVWSNLRNKIVPKNLYFIIAFFLVMIVTSVLKYVKAKETHEKIRIELFWLIIATGLLQFPMPFIGNGEADTSKQLFLFNYTFDIEILVSLTWFINKLYQLIKQNLDSNYIN